MSTTAWIAVIVGVVIVAGIVLLTVTRTVAARRRARLQERFGPEYDRTVGATGSRRKADKELSDRESHHEELDLKPLPETARARYLDEWEGAQRRFVDDPKSAALEAERIVRRVMDDRGYPDGDVDGRAAVVSVDHPDVVQRYRHGHEMVRAGDRETENLRKAMVDFRAVFEALLEPDREPVGAQGAVG